MQLLTSQRMIANGIAQYCFDDYSSILDECSPDSATIDSLSSPKLTHFRDLVQGLVIDQRRKVVVFSQWRRMLRLAQWSVQDLLADAGLRAANFTGAESQARRAHNVVDFHEDPSCAILFCTDAGGVGLNLQRAANACINLELAWNPAVLDQRTARIHRFGQADPVDVFNLVSSPSIESRIYSILGNKKALFTGIFDEESATEIRFEQSAGFMATVQLLTENAESAGDDADDAALDTSLAALAPGAPGIEPPAELDLDAGLSVYRDKSDAGEEQLSEPGQPQPLDPAASHLPLDEPEPVEQTPALPSSRHSDEISPNPRSHAEDHALPSVTQISHLFSQLSIQIKSDGGVRIDAAPEAARTLGILLGGLARLLGGDSHGEVGRAD